MVAMVDANKITDTVQNVLKIFIFIWAPDLHLSYSDLTQRQGTRMAVTATRVTYPISIFQGIMQIFLSRKVLINSVEIETL